MIKSHSDMFSSVSSPSRTPSSSAVFKTSLSVSHPRIFASLYFLNALANGLGTSIGFLLIIVVFSAIRVRLETANTPKAFKGLPIALVTAAIMAIALMGLQGLFSGLGL